MAKEIAKKLRHFRGGHFGFRQPLIKTTLFKTTKLRHFRSHPVSSASKYQPQFSETAKHILFCNSSKGFTLKSNFETHTLLH